VHFSEQCRGAAITQRCHVEDPKAPLEGRGGEAGKQCLLKEEIGFRGGVGHATCEITDGSENFGRKSTDDVNVTDVTVGWEASESELGFSMLKPASRVIQPKGWQSELMLGISGLRKVSGKCLDGSGGSRNGCIGRNGGRVRAHAGVDGGVGCYKDDGLSGRTWLQ
jgi:hypothetical protein